MLSALASIPQPKFILLVPRDRQGSLGWLSIHYQAQSDLELLVLLPLPPEKEARTTVLQSVRYWGWEPGLRACRAGALLRMEAHP